MKEAIQDLLRRIPPGYPKWSVQTVRAYKKAAEHAKKVVNGRASDDQLRTAHNVLAAFHKEGT